MIRLSEVAEGGYGSVDKGSETVSREAGFGVGVEGRQVAVLGPENVDGVWRVAENCVE